MKATPPHQLATPSRTMQAKAHRLVECQRFDAHARSEIYKGSILVFRQSKALGKLVEITEKMRAKSEGEDKYKGKPQQQLPSDLYLSSPHSHTICASFVVAQVLKQLWKLKH